MNLGPRHQEVLEQVVEHYIQTGSPVASRRLAQLNSEGLSSATIRGLLAELEEAGLLSHPHTSAGRLPTDLGYRAYVNKHSAEEERRVLTPQECSELELSVTAEGPLDSLVDRCCHLLSVASSMVAIGLRPEHGSTIYRHVELIRIAERRVLVLFIAGSGVVRQQVVVLSEDESQSDLARYAAFLNEELAGRSLGEVRDLIIGRMKEERTVYDKLVRRALIVGGRYFLSDDDPGDELLVDGTDRILEEPPGPADFDQMKALLAALEQKRRIVHMLNSCLNHDEVTTTIGSEHEDPDLTHCSIVATNYSCDDERIGAIGLIGPTRMDYDRAIALVDHVAGLLGRTLGVAHR
ncbi:MAG: heat-inducible transcriptional repressor HrcA [Acidobacteriota bacterium]